MMALTFDDLTEKCSPEERDALAFHLAMYRAKTTYEGLRFKGGKGEFYVDLSAAPSSPEDIGGGSDAG